MTVGKKYYVDNDPIPFTLIRIVDGVHVFFKKNGNSERRIELTETQFKNYNVHE